MFSVRMIKNHFSFSKGVVLILKRSENVNRVVINKKNTAIYKKRSEAKNLILKFQKKIKSFAF